MIKQVLITHPETGEKFNKKDWADKLGITRNNLNKRLRNHPLPVALSPKKLPTGRNLWSKEEDDYLCCIYRTPNLYKK
jgi:hypothetical protein